MYQSARAHASERAEGSLDARRPYELGRGGPLASALARGGAYERTQHVAEIRSSTLQERLSA